MNVKKILVTGGAGFIGSYLANELSKNNNVTVIDNLSKGKKDLIKSNVKFIKIDLLNKNKVLKNVKGFDFIFHLAANPDTRAGLSNPEIDVKQNIIVTHNILEAMRINKIKNIIFTSSSTVYGEVKLPTKENNELKPISFYGASKLSAEFLISVYCYIFDMRCWIFRLANVIGPNFTHGAIYDFIKKLKENKNELRVLGNGSQTKSYIYIDDCIKAMLLAIEKSSERVNVFNVGSEDCISVRRIAELVTSKISPNAKIIYGSEDRGWKGDVPKMLLDISKIKRLGWKPKYTSEESVKKTIELLTEKF